MAQDTFKEIWSKVKNRAPALPVPVARDITNNAFRRLAERRRWSWLVRRGDILTPAAYTTGTVTVTHALSTITGSGTTWTAAMVGRQFRIGTSDPIYDVLSVDSTTQITIGVNGASVGYGGDSAAGVGYEIYQAHITMPSDFQAFITIWDPAFNWQLHRNVTQSTLNHFDSQRTNTGSTAYLVAFLDYDQTSGLPRYELWPHQKTQYVYPYFYWKRAGDLEDGTTLPYTARGDVLLEMALADAARWKHDTNKYYDLRLAQVHDDKAEKMIAELELRDNEIWQQDLIKMRGLGYAPLPWMDAAWMQSHDVGGLYG